MFNIYNVRYGHFTLENLISEFKPFFFNNCRLIVQALQRLRFTTILTYCIINNDSFVKFWLYISFTRPVCRKNRDAGGSLHQDSGVVIEGGIWGSPQSKIITTTYATALGPYFKLFNGAHT